MFEWLRRLFVPDENGEDPYLDEESGFKWNEHMRIITAFLVVICSALAMWWILM